MPQHTVTLRQLTGEERARLSHATKMTTDCWAWVALPSLALPFIGYLCGALLSRFFGLAAGKPALTLIGLVAGAWGSAKVYSGFSAGRCRANNDLRDSTVEVFDVSDPLVLTQEENNDEGPIFYIDIGDGKILFLWGQ